MRRQDELRLTFDGDENGEGYLRAEVWGRGFAGHGEIWVAATGLLRLAKELQQTYPLSVEKPITLIGGFEGEGDAVQRTHVALRFYPIGSVGEVGCQVCLASPIYQGTRPESQSRVVVELSTRYEQLAAFGRGVEMLAEGRVPEAVLGGQGETT